MDSLNCGLSGLGLPALAKLAGRPIGETPDLFFKPFQEEGGGEGDEEEKGAAPEGCPPVLRRLGVGEEGFAEEAVHEKEVEGEFAEAEDGMVDFWEAGGFFTEVEAARVGEDDEGEAAQDPERAVERSENEEGRG